MRQVVAYIEDITRWREDMNFIFKWQNNIYIYIYRQKDIDKIIEGNHRNYDIDKLTCEIMENKSLGSRM